MSAAKSLIPFARPDVGDAEIDAVGVETLGLLEDAQPLVGREVALHQRDRAGPSARARERLDESELCRELVAFAFEIESAVAEAMDFRATASIDFAETLGRQYAIHASKSNS